MKRLFIFGCSQVKYQYPTWADMLINDLEYDKIYGVNAGAIGAGNQFISARIWETNARMHFNKDDQIIVMWSSFFRDDRYITGYGWHLAGNIFHHRIDTPFMYCNFLYNDENQWKDINHFLYRDCNTITSTIEGIHGTGAQILSTHMINPYKDKLLLELDSKGILDLYKPWLEPQAECIIDHSTYPGVETDKTRPTYKQDVDNTIHIEDHPTPLEHFDYLESCIAPALDIKIKTSTKEYAQEWQKKLIDNNDKTYPVPGWNPIGNVNWLV